MTKEKKSKKNIDIKSAINSEQRLTNFSYLLLLLALGAQTMILELTMPRILAPTFGNTLFCWTAIITVVLIALSIGYYLGGLLATQNNIKRLIGLFSALSAVWVLGLSLVGESITSYLSELGLMLGPLVAALLLSTVPAIFAAAVVPLVVEMRLGEPGRVAGQCYAWSTLGSIFGAFLTGYILLPHLGISGTLLISAGIVFISLLIIGKRVIGLAGLLLIFIIKIIPSNPDPGILFDKSNGYHRIRIIASGNTNMRTLFLDSTIEGAVEIGNSYPILNYQKKIQQIAELIPGLSRSLFIGGGSFSMPKYIKARYPTTSVDVIEIDPDVINAAYKYLELHNEVNVLVGDGRNVLKHRSLTYDLIVNDAFHGVRNIPFHLVTKEFTKIVKEKLSSHGIYAVNVMGHPTKSNLVNTIVKTIMEEFEYLSLLYDRGNTEQNIWILASSYPIKTGISPRIGEFDKVLTDNKAPVEFLVATELLHERLK